METGMVDSLITLNITQPEHRPTVNKKETYVSQHGQTMCIMETG
jgi:hypothetical protein